MAVVVLTSLGADPQLVRYRMIDVLAGRDPQGYEAFAAVDGGKVEKTDFPVDAASVFTWSDAFAWLADQLDAEARTMRTSAAEVDYQRCTYVPSPLPEISVTRAAFDDYSNEIADAEDVEGLGDAAAYSQAR